MWSKVSFQFFSVFSPKAAKNPKLVTKFYREVTSAISVPSRYEIVILGDFNSKLGKLSVSDVSNNISNYVGNFGMGTRNDNGEHLLNFICGNKLFALNTA